VVAVVELPVPPQFLRALAAELLAPVGWRLAGLDPPPPPPYALEDRILLAQGEGEGDRQPICTMTRHSPWPFSTLAPAKACKQPAFSRAVHVAMAAAPSLGSGRKQLARDPGAAGAAYVSTRRVRSLEQVAGVQKRDPPLAYTARSGVESQQDDAGITAELVLVRRSKAAHS
jgi:hypothetical protein